VPVRPPSKLPPPGELCLHVSIEPEQLGYGRSGTVYPIHIENPSQLSLPPLVIKVARRHRSENLSRDAWFYEEMEHLQGVAIARCYGFFTADIDINNEVLGWVESNGEYDPEVRGDFEDEYEETSDMASGSDEGLDSHPNKDNNARKDDPVALPSAPISKERILVSVLVLERLGGMIPMDVPIDSITLVFVSWAFTQTLRHFHLFTGQISWRFITTLGDLGSSTWTCDGQIY
jgi:hypothetical protein